MTIYVHCLPGPQGSKSPKGRDGKGRTIMVESSKKVKPWREAVCFAAIEAMGGAGAGRITGPVYLDVTFTLPKPKSAPKRRRTWPDRKPDLSKLIRSTEDALTSAGVWDDDARVVRCVAAKVFPNEGCNSLTVPGAVIMIRPAVDPHAFLNPKDSEEAGHADF